MGKPKVTRYFHAKNDEADSDKPDKRPKKPTKQKTKSKEFGEFVKFDVKDRPRRMGDNRTLVKLSKMKTDPKKKFTGKVPVDKNLLKKHSRGEGMNVKNIRLNVNRYKFKQKEKLYEFSNEQAARAEVLLTEESGSLAADKGETTTQFRQEQILDQVDITAATKHFELILHDFGPYRMKYTRNGRHLLLGGKMGHLAAFDWVTKKLHCELNVMESIHDVCWLHMESMFAVAQKNWVYIYDNQGIELHCLKKLNKVSRMQFLPYHFLLATASEEGFLSWLDVSIGQMVSQYNCRLGRLSMLCQNPQNAVLCCGHTKGIVSMWSPNMREPLAKMLCHKSALTSLHVDPKGMYMATSAIDRGIRIWDIRNLQGPVQSYRVRSAATDIAFSEKNMLAIGMGNVVEVYKDCCVQTAKHAYLRHVMNTTIGNLSFCPYEDVLGVATATGFTSLLVPGSGEPNYDALEANPFQTKSQRREAEVKALLEKIQPEFITLDPGALAEVDVPTLKEKLEAKKKLLYVKPSTLDLESRKKKRGSSVKAAKTKKIIQEQVKRDFIKSAQNVKLQEEPKSDNVDKPKSVLDRFLPKK